MGYLYTQLSLDERCTIARLHEDGQSIRQIAKTLDRAPSSVARELKRGSLKTKGYAPAYAWQMAKARRWKGSRMERQPALRDYVLQHLATASAVALAKGDGMVATAGLRQAGA